MRGLTPIERPPAFSIRRSPCANYDLDQYEPDALAQRPNGTHNVFISGSSRCGTVPVLGTQLLHRSPQTNGPHLHIYASPCALPFPLNALRIRVTYNTLFSNHSFTLCSVVGNARPASIRLCLQIFHHPTSLLALLAPHDASWRPCDASSASSGAITLRTVKQVSAFRSCMIHRHDKLHNKLAIHAFRAAGLTCTLPVLLLIPNTDHRPADVLVQPDPPPPDMPPDKPTAYDVTIRSPYTSTGIRKAAQRPAAVAEAGDLSKRLTLLCGA